MAKLQCDQIGEGADALGHLAELIVADAEAFEVGSLAVLRQGLQLIVGQV